MDNELLPEDFNFKLLKGGNTGMENSYDYNECLDTSCDSNTSNSSCGSGISSDGSSRLFCFDCNMDFVCSLDDIAEAHFQHRLYSEKTLEKFLRKEKLVDKKIVELSGRLTENSLVHRKLNHELKNVSNQFKQIHERICMEEEKIKNHLEKEIRKSSDVMRSIYGEYIQYWRMNKWMGLNGNTNENEEASAQGKSNDGMEMNKEISDLIENFQQFKSNDNNSNVDFLIKNVGETVKNEKCDSEIILVNHNTEEELPFSLISHFKSSNEQGASSQYQYMAKFPCVNIKDELKCIVEDTCDQSVIIELPIPTQNDAKRVMSNSFRMLDNDWKIALEISKNKETNVDWLSAFIYLNKYTNPLDVYFKIQIENYPPSDTTHNFKEKSGWGWREYIKFDAFKSMQDNKVRVSITMKHC